VQIETQRIEVSAAPITPAPIAALQVAPEGRNLRPQFPPRIRLLARGREDLGATKVKLPIDWEMDPFHDRNWCAQLHSWHMIDGCLFAFDKTRDPAVLEAAKLVALDWQRSHAGRARRNRSPHSWRDKISGHRAGKIAYILSQWQHGLLPLSAEEQAQMTDLARSHLDFLVNKATVTYSNHSFFHLLGVRALVEVVGPEDVRGQILEFVNEKVATLVGRQFDPNGMHKEHSFGYQKFGISTLKLLVKTGWFDALALKELNTKAKALLPWMRIPDGRLAPIGDTTTGPPTGATDTTFPQEQNVVDQSGYAIVRADKTGKVSDASYFVLSGAFHSSTHKHADDLSVYWFEGEEILSDPGKYSYNRDQRREYVVSTNAHNTVEIDGKSFSTKEEDAYGSAIGTVACEDWGYRVSGSVDHKTSGVRHTRTCFYAPGAWLLLLDKMSADRAHDYTSWLQLAPELENVARRDGYLEVPLQSGKSLRIFQAGTASPQTTLHRGETEPRMQGWISQSYGDLSPSYSIGTHQTGSNVMFATLLVLNGVDGTGVTFSGRSVLTVQVRTNSATVAFEVDISADEDRVRMMNVTPAQS
jgi:hypothetical protein